MTASCSLWQCGTGSQCAIELEACSGMKGHFASSSGHEIYTSVEQHFPFRGISLGFFFAAHVKCFIFSPPWKALPVTHMLSASDFQRVLSCNATPVPQQGKEMALQRLPSLVRAVSASLQSCHIKDAARM